MMMSKSNGNPIFFWLTTKYQNLASHKAEKNPEENDDTVTRIFIDRKITFSAKTLGKIH